MVIAAVALGGGGTSNPQTEIPLEVTIALLLALALAMPSSAAPAGRVPAMVWWIALPGLLLALGQLVPLPPAIWRNLPGRDAERAALDLIGAGGAWMPLSIAPATTFSALLALLVPLAVLVMVARLDVRGRAVVLAGVALVALVSIVLGALQLSQLGGASWALYPFSNLGWLIGFQANRNAEADILQIGMLAAAATGLAHDNHQDPGALRLPLVLGALVVLAIGVLMTGSRAGIALTAMTAVWILAIAWPGLVRKVRHLWWWLAGVTLGLLAAAVALTRFAAIQTVIDRFGTDTEGRWDFWIDTVYALRKAWPAGTGIGTFSIAYEAAERLETVSDLFPYRAHNDWLEWTLESGAAGWLAGVLMLAALAWSARLAWRRGAGHPVVRGQVLFGIAVLVNESLHAAVDFPMRAMSLATLVAVAMAMMTPVSTEPDAPCA